MANLKSQFEEIILPPVLLAGLFNSSVVVIEETGQNEKTLKEHQLLEESTLLEELSVASEPEEPSANNILEPTLQESVSWLGNFNKQVLVFVHDERNLHLGESELDLLIKMLQALKLSIADIAVVNCGRQSVSWPAVSSELPAKQVIFFGVDPSTIQVPIRLPHFRVHSWNNSKMLYSPSLLTINTVSAEQTALKKELWKALQELFTTSL